MNPKSFSQPKFSIVIDNFNNGRFLQEAIDSCLNQTLPAHEIIVVDDGSTDHSRILLKNYEGMPTIKIILQENQGQEAALQKGFDHCTGDWILGLDADDFYLPECLKTLSASLHKDYSLIYFRAQIIDAEGQHYGELIPPGTMHSEGNVIDSWITQGSHHSFPPQSFNCYPAHLIRSLRIFPHEFLSMKKGFSSDRYLQYKAALSGKIQPVGYILGAYRIQEKGDNTKKRNNLTLLRQSILANDLAISHVQKELNSLCIKPHPLFQFDHYYWFYRMLSLVTDPAGHTHPADSRFSLFRMNLLSEWKDSRRHDLINRWVNYLKIFLMLILPSGLFFQIYLLRPKHKITRMIRSLKNI
jgi:glycosyltransferase involved in cell wall biosynthesis